MPQETEDAVPTSSVQVNYSFNNKDLNYVKIISKQTFVTFLRKKDPYKQFTSLKIHRRNWVISASMILVYFLDVIGCRGLQKGMQIANLEATANTESEELSRFLM